MLQRHGGKVQNGNTRGRIRTKCNLRSYQLLRFTFYHQLPQSQFNEKFFTSDLIVLLSTSKVSPIKNATRLQNLSFPQLTATVATRPRCPSISQPFKPIKLPAHKLSNIAAGVFQPALKLAKISNSNVAKLFRLFASCRRGHFRRVKFFCLIHPAFGFADT